MQMVRDAKALWGIADEQGLEVEDLEFYGYMNEVEGAVIGALGEFAGEFDAEKLVREMYYNIPYNEFGRDVLRWCWLDGALGEFNHQWGLSDLGHAY